MPPPIPKIHIQTPITLAKSLFTSGRTSSSCRSITSTRTLHGHYLANPPAPPAPPAPLSLSLAREIPRQFTYFSSMAEEVDHDDDDDDHSNRALHRPHDPTDIAPTFTPTPERPTPRPRLDALRKRLQTNSDITTAPTLKQQQTPSGER